jgi:hypothetical protein
MRKARFGGLFDGNPKIGVETKEKARRSGLSFQWPVAG